jgi:hypothetical protein
MLHHRMFAAILWVLPVAASAGEPFGSLGVKEVASRLGDGRTFLFDCNPRDVFAQRHLPGARWVDYKNLTSADLPADRSATLVFYCANEH